MSSSSTSLAPDQRLEVLFEQLAELAGSAMPSMGASWTSWRRWIAMSCGATGRGRWRRWWPETRRVLGQRPHHHHHRRAARAVPRCAQGMRDGQLSLDQVGVIAARAAEGSDEHYAQLAAVATVNQLRTAVKLEPRPIRIPARTGALDHHDRHRGVHQLAHHLAARRGRPLRRGPEIPSRRADRRLEGRPRHRWHRAVTAAASTVDGFLRLIEAVGTPKPRGARIGRTPPSWSTSTSSAAPPPCTWAHCSPAPNAGI